MHFYRIVCVCIIFLTMFLREMVEANLGSWGCLHPLTQLLTWLPPACSSLRWDQAWTGPTNQLNFIVWSLNWTLFHLELKCASIVCAYVICVSFSMCPVKSFVWTTWVVLPSRGREESSSCWWLSWRTGKVSLTPWLPPIVSKFKPGNKTGGGCSLWSRGADIWMVRIQIRICKCAWHCMRHSSLLCRGAPETQRGDQSSDETGMGGRIQGEGSPKGSQRSPRAIWGASRKAAVYQPKMWRLWGKIYMITQKNKTVPGSHCGVS